MNYLDYKPSIYDNFFPDLIIDARGLEKVYKYTKLIHNEVFSDDRVRQKLFNAKFTYYWKFLSTQLQKSSYSHQQLICIKDYFETKMRKQVYDRIMDETDKLVWVLYIAKSPYINCLFNAKNSVKVDYFRDRGKQEKKRVMEKLLQGYSKYRVPTIIENEFLVPLTQAEIIANPISVYNKIIAEETKFYKKKYPDELWDKAQYIFSHANLDEKMTYQDALFEAIQFFPKYIHIDLDSTEFLVMSNAYKKHRSRTIKNRQSRK